MNTYMAVTNGWAALGLMVLASVLVLGATALWLVELVDGWPGRNRGHPVREESERREHPRPGTTTS